MESVQLLEYSIPSLSLDLSKTNDPNRYSGETNINGSSNRKLNEEKNWRRIKQFVESSYDDECLFIQDQSHCFLNNKDQKYLLNCIQDSVRYNSKILLGNAFGIEQIIPLNENLQWIDYFEYSSLMVLFKPLYDDILDFKQKEFSGFWNSLNYLTSHKLLVYPYVADNFLPVSHKLNDSIEKILLIRDIDNSINRI